jgi:hypothetical protein
LNRDVVQELAGARLSREMREYAREAILRYGTVYLDVAEPALLFGNTLELRALFVADAVGGIRFWAVFRELGRRETRRVAWVEGCDHLVTDPYDDPEVRDYQACAGSPAPVLRPLIEIAREAGIDLREVLEGSPTRPVFLSRFWECSFTSACPIGTT